MSQESDENPLLSPALEIDTAASRALHIVDIVQEILESLCPPFSSLSDYQAFLPIRRNIINTALTCRSFLEPSLDVLWRSMHSIIPLLKLLPSEDFRLQNGQYVLTGLPLSPTSPHWGRIQSYSRRIRAFYYDPTALPTSPLAPHTCITISHHFPSSLLPNTSNLYIGRLDPTDNMVLFPIISSPIRRLEVSNIGEANNNLIQSLLVCLKGTSHKLQHLTLSGTWPSQVIQLAGEFRDLVKLDLSQTIFGHTLQSTIEALASLPFLRTLMLNLGDGVGQELPVTNWSASLAHLTLIGSVSQVSFFLKNNQILHVDDIALQFPHNYAGDTDIQRDFSLLLEILREMGSRSNWLNIKGVALDIGRFTRQSVSEPQRLIWSIFCPFDFDQILELLTTHAQLERLSIQPDTPSWLTGFYTFKKWRLANAFPLLEHLTLPHNNVATFDFLYSIAILCPRLRTLAIKVDTNSFPSLPSAQYSVLAHGLEVLSVGDSPLHNVSLVTRHLNRLFPHLRTIRGTTSQAAWSTVQDMLELQRSMILDSSDRRPVTQDLVDKFKAANAPSPKAPKKKKGGHKT